MTTFDEKFPDGKLDEHDEGMLEIRVGTKKGSVVIEFGKPILWIGMPPDEAAELGISLIERARKIGLKKLVKIEI